MTRDEFIGLPASIALGLLWDLGAGVALENTAPPKPPASPKYDQRIYRKGGHQWASETDLEGLEYWRGRYQDGAASGGEYAAKDAKRAKSIGYWVAWRQAFPTAVWSGERDNAATVAAMPSRNPTLHSAAPRTQEATKAAPSFDDGEEQGDIPF